MSSPVPTVDRRSVDLTAFAMAARQLEANPQVWIETNSLLADIVRASNEPIPENVVAHLRERLDGTARKRQGRGRVDSSAKLRNALIAVVFHRYEA